MIWLAGLCIILIIAVIVLSVKILLMRRAAEEIRKGLAERLKSDTNTLIAVPSRDRAIRRLAADINVSLRELRGQRQRFVQGDIELKGAVTNISHDLRTPLTAISGYLDLLESEEKSPAVSRYIEIIKNRTEALRQLTEELFRYSVITSPEHDSPAEQVTVNAVLEESIAAFYAALGERRITPNIHITDKKIVRHLNRAALSRIFSNLITNAIKYSGGDLAISLTDGGEITFANTAPGLSEVQVERLFDRFYTVENARKSTGLGLSISRILIEQMGGTIFAQYENGQLKITVLLPENCIDIF